jgi:hypothetical protein
MRISAGTNLDPTAAETKVKISAMKQRLSDAGWISFKDIPTRGRRTDHAIGFEVEVCSVIMSFTNTAIDITISASKPLTQADSKQQVTRLAEVMNAVKDLFPGIRNLMEACHASQHATTPHSAEHKTS